MSNDLNHCTFIGRLGKAPETRYLPNGDAVCNFSIAVGERWTDKQSGEKKEKTEWINVVTFRKLAEICSQYLEKGQQVYIAGKFRTRKWQDKEGHDRYSTEIVAESMQMLGGKRDESSAAPKTHEQNANDQRAEPEASDAGFEDDDIPF